MLRRPGSPSPGAPYGVAPCGRLCFQEHPSGGSHWAGLLWHHPWWWPRRYLRQCEGVGLRRTQRYLYRCLRAACFLGPEQHTSARWALALAAGLRPSYQDAATEQGTTLMRMFNLAACPTRCDVTFLTIGLPRSAFHPHARCPSHWNPMKVGNLDCSTVIPDVPRRKHMGPGCSDQAQVAAGCRRLQPGLRARNPGTVAVTRRRVAGCCQPGLRLLQARATCGSPSAILRVAVAFALCWQALRPVAHGVCARSYGTHGLHPKLSSLMPVQYVHIPQVACGVQVGENMRTQVVHPTALAALMRGATHDSGCAAQRPRRHLSSRPGRWQRTAPLPFISPI
jgi:hypothetical protein